MRSSIEGNGHKTATEAYPFRGLDLYTQPYPAPYIGLSSFRSARARQSLDRKHHGQRTPFGTPVAQVIRQNGEFLNGFGGEYLESQCGNCRVPMDRCRCNFHTLSRGPLDAGEVFDNDL